MANECISARLYFRQLEEHESVVGGSVLLLSALKFSFHNLDVSRGLINSGMGSEQS